MQTSSDSHENSGPKKSCLYEKSYQVYLSLRLIGDSLEQIADIAVHNEHGFTQETPVTG